MIQNAREIDFGRELDFDVCIIGSGAAGITLARSLDPKLTVCVLESGGFERDERTQALYDGRNVGRRYFRLDSCRQRRFGGSTNCWAGMCVPLDPIDFESREWIPHSGWPITRTDLDRFYERAHEMLHLAHYEYRPEMWADWQRRPFEFSARSDVRSGVFQINSTRSRMWGETYRQELESSQNIRVLLWANATEIVLDPNGRIVSHLAVRVLNGPLFIVRARHYVLAAGGIENARLLLASRSVQAAGVGNDRDLVGRFFMEHPHVHREGLFLGSARANGARFYRPFRADGTERVVDIWGYLTVTPSAQQRERMLSFALVLLDTNGGSADTPAVDRSLVQTIAGFDGLRESSRLKNAILRVSPKPIRDRLSTEPVVAPLGWHSEQAPNPDSRVVLDTLLDPLGVPRVKLDWRLSAIDKYTIRRAQALIGPELGAANIARLKPTLSEDDETWPTQTQGGWHHMGTTRMHDDPARGVVDRHGVVHGVANLSVAGSSIFPTSGSANPTLTIVALALRKASRLNEELTR